MKNSRGSKKKQYACVRNQISTFPDIWSSYSISFLSEDLFGNRCSSFGCAARQWRSTRSPLCNIWFTWTIISSCQMTDLKVRDVAVSNEGREKRRLKHVPRIRWMSKFTLHLSQKLTHFRGVTLAQVQMQIPLSPSVKQNFLFPSFLHSSLFFPLLLHFASFIPPEPIGISLDETSDVSGACLESVWPHQCWAEERRRATGAENPVGPKFGPGSGTAPHHIGSRAVTHPSVCGLGWRGGRGELQVSHGKACFIVCLREWRMEGRERGMVGSEGGWERREVGSWAWGEEQGGKRNELKIRIEDTFLTCREMEGKSFKSKGWEVDTSNSICLLRLWFSAFPYGKLKDSFPPAE